MPVQVGGGRGKVTVTLRVVVRGVDAYHVQECVVAFADCADRLRLTRCDNLNLETIGPLESDCGQSADNLVLKAAQLLGHPADHVRYAALAQKIRAAINAKYLNRQTNLYGHGVQTELSVPLYWGVVPDELRAKVAANLARRVAADNFHLDVGLLAKLLGQRLQPVKPPGHQDEIGLLHRRQVPGNLLTEAAGRTGHHHPPACKLQRRHVVTCLPGCQPLILRPDEEAHGLTATNAAEERLRFMGSLRVGMWRRRRMPKRSVSRGPRAISATSAPATSHA